MFGWVQNKTETAPKPLYFWGGLGQANLVVDHPEEIV